MSQNVLGGRALRVTIFLNGDHQSGGKLLTIPEDSTMNVAELCAKASQELCADVDRPISRIFNDRGLEITAVHDINPGDLLYFSFGEEFKLAGSPALGDAVEGKENSGDKQQADISSNGSPAGGGANAGAYPYPPGGMLQSFASSAARAVSAGYASTSAYIKARAPESVGKRLDQLEQDVSHRSAPMMRSAEQYAKPALKWADDKINETQNKIRIQKELFMASDLGRQLNEALFLPVRDCVIVPAEVFYDRAKDSYNKIRQRRVNPAAAAGGSPANEGGAPAVADADLPPSYPGHSPRPNSTEAVAAEIGVETGEFIAAMRESLGKMWNERFAPSARMLYDYFRQQDIAREVEMRQLSNDAESVSSPQ